MSDTYFPTILDIVYEVLEHSGQPLTPHEIEDDAARMGYDLRAWEAAYEIEAHLEAYGPRSPFVQVGRSKYWLDTFPLRPAPPGPLPFMRWVSVIAVIVAGVFVWLVYSGISARHSSLSAIVQQVNALTGDVDPAAAEAASQPPAELGAAWWVSNAVNQLNAETQEISRDLLTNYYNTCGPAVIAMVVSYYRNQAGDASGKLSPADVLTDARAQLGYYLPPYNSGLLDFHNLDDLASYYGLQRVAPADDGALLTTAELIEAVRQGHPAIAGMRYGYNGPLYIPRGGSGLYNHFIVVFAVQEQDGQEMLLIVNTHPGKDLVDDADARPELITIEEFEGSWLLNDGSDSANFGYAAFYQPVE